MRNRLQAAAGMQARCDALLEVVEKTSAVLCYAGHCTLGMGGAECLHLARKVLEGVGLDRSDEATRLIAGRAMSRIGR